MNDVLTELLGQMGWPRINASASVLVFTLLLLRSDQMFRWPDGRDCPGKAISALGRTSLIAVMVGCVGNVQDWIVGAPHRPSEVLMNVGLALFLLARIAEVYLPRLTTRPR